ncbi:MAG: cell wall hydrolase [Candidatus Limivivens sp.]|nr:cell wall hydrolase [Candidatus Limivivens sp.]
MKGKKKTVLCCTMTAAALSMAVSANAFADSVWSYRAVADSLSGVNIRSGASDASTIVGYLPTGGAADVIEKGEEWSLVTSGGVEGYVKNEYLAMGEDAMYLADVYGYDGVKTDWDGVCLFSEPDGASQVLATANAGSEYTVVEDQGDWLMVQLDDATTAYVPAEDVQPTTVLEKATAAQTADSYAGPYTESSTGGDSYYYDDSSSTDEYYYDDSSSEDGYSYDDSSSGDSYYYDDSSSEDGYSYDDSSSGDNDYYDDSSAGAEDSYYETEAPVYETEAPSVSASSSDLDLLAAIIYCEAGNQSRDGKIAVGAVVLNRVASSSFANSISGVIYESGQFTPAMTGWLDQVLAGGGAPSDCYEAAQAALNGENPVGGALYFNGGSGKGIQIGDHQFY